MLLKNKCINTNNIKFNEFEFKKYNNRKRSKSSKIFILTY